MMATMGKLAEKYNSSSVTHTSQMTETSEMELSMETSESTEDNPTGLFTMTTSTLSFPDNGMEISENSTPDYYYYDNDCEYYSSLLEPNMYIPGCYDHTQSNYELKILPFENAVLGYLQPTLVFLTALTNIFVVGFFITKKNNRKATDLLFISIAFSDTLTGLTLVPNSIHVYAEGNVYLTAAWCDAYMILRFYVSPVFHTVSVWQTLVLGIQRYLCVCHPFISGRICTFWKTFVSIVVMYCFSIVLHTYHLTDNKKEVGRCRWLTEDPCVVSCMYLWFCLVLQHLVPCLLLLLLAIFTLMGLWKAQKRASSMSLNGRIRKNSLRSTQDRVITITTTLIVICFMIPELPHGIYKLVFVVYKHLDMRLHENTNHIFIGVYEIALLISFSANFWIYCIVMQDFRYKLLSILSCGTYRQNVSRQRSCSVSSKCGSMINTLSRTNSSAGHNRLLSRSTSGRSTKSEIIHSVVVPVNNASRKRVLSCTTSLHSTASEKIHSVVPLTPTRGYDNIKFTDNCREHPELKPADSDPNDDVFC